MENKGEPHELIGLVHVGELVGEMGFLTKAKRSLSVKAIEKTTLMEISEKDFFYLVKIEPSSIYEILLQVIKRKQKLLEKRVREHRKFIIVLQANRNFDFSSFKDKIFQLNNKNDLLQLSEEVLIKSYREKGLLKTIDYITGLDYKHKSIIYFLDYNKFDEYIELNQLLITLSSSVMFLVDGTEEPTFFQGIFSKVIPSKLININKTTINKFLVLCWNNCKEIKGTQRWKDKGHFTSHFHVMTDDDESYKRLIRFWSGKSIGLVLGAGATRCWTHIGVIKALQEKNIPIDFIAGSSSGAGVAATYMLNNDINELIKINKEISNAMKATVSIPSLTTIYTSIYNPAKMIKCLQGLFGYKHIEDLVIPYLSVSYDINNNQEIVHRSGLLWKSILASCSIPFFLPPVTKDDSVLIDGGVINTVPVNHLKDIYGIDLKIIASDLDTIHTKKVKYRFIANRGLMDVVKSKVIGKKRNYVAPGMFTIFMKSMMAGSMNQYQVNMKNADYKISHKLREFDFFEFDDEVHKKMIEIGYNNTLNLLKESDILIKDIKKNLPKI
ncbi:MAG: patatin-like phospholipase family protein [Rickettsiaceae bacterium]|nr:patatin-like phospholipase family protein [Rickettsiaceae bacterium]